MDDMSVLEEFELQIDRAARYVEKRFHPNFELDDILQEARILVLSYAGDIEGRLHGHLSEWRAITTNPEGPMGLLYRQLSADLCQIFSRKLNKVKESPVGIYIEEILTETGAAPLDPVLGFEEDRLRDDYPFLMMRYDGHTEKQMAMITGVSVVTVRRHIHNERQQAYNDPFLLELMGKDE